MSAEDIMRTGLYEAFARMEDARRQVESLLDKKLDAVIKEAYEHGANDARREERCRTKP